MPKVFISHSTLDRDFVEREIVGPLHRAGIETWYSKTDIQAADRWERSIHQGLKDCDWFLLVMSPRAEQSEWVRDELHWAMDNRLGRIVPVLIDECDPCEFHIRLQRLQFIDLRKEEERPRARTALLKLWGIAPPPRPKPAPPQSDGPTLFPLSPRERVAAERPGEGAPVGPDSGSRPHPAFGPPLPGGEEKDPPAKGAARQPQPPGVRSPVIPPPEYRANPRPEPRPQAAPPGPRPPGRLKTALAASFGGFLLLGIIIYITTDKGEVKIDLGEPKVKTEVRVEQDGEKVAHVTVEPKSPAPAPAPSAPLSKPQPKPPAPSPPAPSPTKEWTSPFTGMKLVLVPAGSFDMGSPEDDKDASSDEKPRHPVRITRPFYLGQYEVTQGEYERVMGKNPSWFSKTGPGKDKVQGVDTERLPVEYVSWFDAVRYCNALSLKDKLKPFYAIEGDDVTTRVTVPDWEGEGYRLPTEAEWEYACRAGSSTRYALGDDVASVKELGWFADNSGKDSWDAAKFFSDNDVSKYPEEFERHGCVIHPVGGKRANAFKLYDMHGNVCEWCWDWYDESYYKNKSSNVDPKGPETGDARVLRGGSWSNDASYLRSAFRFRLAPASRYVGGGFRLARTYH